MPELAHAPLGLSIVYLLRQAENQAPARARELILRTRQEIQDAALQRDLVELIETVVLYKLPRLSREEIQAMLQVHDIRETRVYQEAREEGLKEGMEKGKEKQRRAISKMAARNMSVAEIADILGLDEQVVRQYMANGSTKSS